MKSVTDGLTLDYSVVKDSIVEFLRREFAKRNKEVAILGLSGGVDSALVAFLCKEAGLDLFVVLMPYGSGEGAVVSERDAMLISNVLGIADDHVLKVDITRSVDISREETEETGLFLDRIDLGNLMARRRMSVLFSLARRLGGLVLGTENRSEYYFGYFTLHGDQASSIDPISGLWKTQVRALAKYVGVPDAILKKAPSAGLWSGQTDEGELGFTYDEADCVLHSLYDREFLRNWHHVFKDAPDYVLNALVRNVSRDSSISPEVVLKILKTIQGTEYKRELPPAWSLKDLHLIRN